MYHLHTPQYGLGPWRGVLHDRRDQPAHRRILRAPDDRITVAIGHIIRSPPWASVGCLALLIIVRHYSFMDVLIEQTQSITAVQYFWM